MVESNGIEYRDNKIYTRLVYEVSTGYGLVENYSVYKLISEDTSLSFDSLVLLAEEASQAFAIKLEQE